MKLTILILLSSVMCCSCKHKDDYLIQVNKVLEKDMSDHHKTAESLYHKIQNQWIQDGSPERLKVLVNKSDSAWQEYRTRMKKLQILKRLIEMDSINENGYLYQLAKITRESGKKSLSHDAQIIQISNHQLKKSHEIYRKMKSWQQEMEGIDFSNLSPYIAFSAEKNKILPGEIYKAVIELAALPVNNHDKFYKAKVNGKVIPIKNGFAELRLSSDSTSNMKAGKYSWTGEITLNYKGRDTTFPVVETFFITDACK